MNNINNPVKIALHNRKLTIGTWIQTGSPVVAEILGNVGFDWIAADMEHTDLDESAFSQLIRALPPECMPFARVRYNDTIAIRRVLDCGAKGIIVPLVNSREEAMKAVQAAKYPPIGERGFAFCRANEWGVKFDEYAASANMNTAVIVMIESREAVNNIESILEVEGVDGAFIGPYDMSGSYGIVGQTNSPVIYEACNKVSKACETYKKSAGIHIVIPKKEEIEKVLSNGFTFIALGMDTVFLDTNARSTLEVVRKTTPGNTSMAALKEVENIISGKGAKVER